VSAEPESSLRDFLGSLFEDVRLVVESTLDALHDVCSALLAQLGSPVQRLLREVDLGLAPICLESAARAASEISTLS
jgi:hypothetical protein